MDGSGDFPTIQVAVDMASPGTVLHLGEGTYSEHVRIDKNLRLVGAGKHKSTIKTAMKGSPITIEGGHVELEDLAIHGGGGFQNRLIAQKKMADKLFTGRQEPFIPLSKIPEGALKSDVGPGVWVVPSAKLTMKDCLVAMHEKEGLRVEGTATIQGSDFSYSGNLQLGMEEILFGESCGVLVEGKGKVKIETSAFSGLAKAVFLRGRNARLEFYANRVAGNLRGITISSSEATVTDSQLQGNRYWGIGAFSQAMITIRNNRISQNDPGIMLGAGTRALIKNNIIAGNGGVGISVNQDPLHMEEPWRTMLQRANSFGEILTAMPGKAEADGIEVESLAGSGNRMGGNVQGALHEALREQLMKAETIDEFIEPIEHRLPHRYALEIRALEDLNKGPEGFFGANKEKVREIGEKIYQRGGHQAMIDVCETIRARIRHTASRELDVAWDGIHGWRG
jgi:parallel beta-helix repeat protein